MRYIKIRFTKGLDIDAYQEVSDHGQVVAYVDEDGMELDVPPGSESHVVEEDAIHPFKEVTRLFREEPGPQYTDTDKDTIIRTLTASLQGAEIPQNLIDKIVGDLLAYL